MSTKSWDLKTWSKGDPNRILKFYKPCDCGCDNRDGKHDRWDGYFSASDKDGNGFTLWIKHYHEGLKVRS